MGLNTLLHTAATSNGQRFYYRHDHCTVMSWWWSKNNCTIARHDSRKKNYFCSCREPKGHCIHLLALWQTQLAIYRKFHLL